MPLYFFIYWGLIVLDIVTPTNTRVFFLFCAPDSESIGKNIIRKGSTVISLSAARSAASGDERGWCAQLVMGRVVWMEINIYHLEMDQRRWGVDDRKKKLGDNSSWALKVEITFVCLCHNLSFLNPHGKHSMRRYFSQHELQCLAKRVHCYDMSVALIISICLSLLTRLYVYLESKP